MNNVGEREHQQITKTPRPLMFKYLKFGFSYSIGNKLSETQITYNHKYSTNNSTSVSGLLPSLTIKI